MLRTRTRAKLAPVLRSWLPLLCASANELDDELKKLAENNPALKLEYSRESSLPRYKKRSNAASIEALNIASRQKYEELALQINNKLFPTSRSQKIAKFIIENLSELGYYEEPSELIKLNFVLLDEKISREEIERVRARFAYLEPAGIGAKDAIEAVKFALIQSELDDESYKIALELAQKSAQAAQIAKNANPKALANAREFLSRLMLPPWLEFAPNSQPIAPDIIVERTPNLSLRVSVADDEYTRVLIDEAIDKKYYAEQISAAANIIEALKLRRATLKKIGLMIIELQYEYFTGGAIVPMKLADIAAELGRNASTISRAIANKYLASPRGLIPLKDFFCTALDDEGTSNAAVKDYLSKLIANENKRKPLSDAALVAMINKELNLAIVRRTVTKYRAQLGIKSSSERKKIYELRGINEL